ncbi:MAG: hypothetical protein J7K54_01815 [Candidatus Aenigmarchaeota archaeon]|nr:hypothetical protein [Candidatus Aenigmarchaeota archaeon]
MHTESYELQMAKTCRKCYTIYDYKRDYCCVRDKESCFADIGLVKKGLKQDERLAEKLFVKKKIDENRRIIDRRFYSGIFRNECLVFDYRPPGCRSHFCWRWDDYIRKHPMDMVYANLRAVSTKTLLKELEREYEYGIKLAYPGGFIIYTYKEKLAPLRKSIEKMLDSMKIRHFRTTAENMSPDANELEGVEVITDRNALLEKPGLFGTLLNNNIFMLVRMKMNLGSTGFSHSNLMLTCSDPEKIAKETPASLKSFHALKAFQV